MQYSKHIIIWDLRLTIIVDFGFCKKDKLDLHRRFGSVIIGVRNGKTC